MPRKISLDLEPAVTERVDKLCALTDTPYDLESLRTRLRRVGGTAANAAAALELDKLEKAVAVETATA